MRFILFGLLAVVLLVPSCVSPLSPFHYPNPVAPPAPLSANDDDDDDEEEGRSFWLGALLYLPNRILDVFDLVRFGVDVGPGAGIQAKVTDAGQAVAIWRFSAGVGFQGFRHLPVQVSHEAVAALGPVSLGVDPGLTWYESPTDIRILVHVLLVGAHVAVDPVEWLDLPAGFILLDPAGDDF